MTIKIILPKYSSICHTSIMARPKNKYGIRAKTRKDGFQRIPVLAVHFEKYPGHWIAAPEKKRGKSKPH